MLPKEIKRLMSLGVKISKDSVTNPILTKQKRKSNKKKSRVFERKTIDASKSRFIYIDSLSAKFKLKVPSFLATKSSSRTSKRLRINTIKVNN